MSTQCQAIAWFLPSIAKCPLQNHILFVSLPFINVIGCCLCEVSAIHRAQIVFLPARLAALTSHQDKKNSFCFLTWRLLCHGEFSSIWSILTIHTKVHNTNISNMHQSNRLNYVVHMCHGRCGQRSHRHAWNERPLQWKLIDNEGGFKAILLWFIIQIGSKKNDALRIGITYDYMDDGQRREKQKLMKTFSFIFSLRNGTDVITRYLLNFIECGCFFFCFSARVMLPSTETEKQNMWIKENDFERWLFKPNICNSHIIL